jgi:hypothetical protein
MLLCMPCSYPCSPNPLDRKAATSSWYGLASFTPVAAVCRTKKVNDHHLSIRSRPTWSSERASFRQAFGQRKHRSKNMRAVFMHYRERRLETPCWMGGLKYEDEGNTNNAGKWNGTPPVESRLSSRVASGMQTRAAMTSAPPLETGSSMRAVYTPPVIPQLFSFPYRPTTASGERDSSARPSSGQHGKKQLKQRPRTAGVFSRPRSSKSSADDTLQFAKKRGFHVPESGSQTDRKMEPKQAENYGHVQGDVNASGPPGRNIFYTLHVKILGIKGMTRKYAQNIGIRMSWFFAKLSLVFFNYPWGQCNVLMME